MNLLLDTHGFLWSLFTPDKLSKAVDHEIKSPNNDVAVSVVTFWEISLKYALGKLELTGVKPEELPDSAGQMNLEILPITAAEASSFHKLPRLSHKDPFDPYHYLAGYSAKNDLGIKGPRFQSVS